jgi:hypothetical protein
MTEEDKRTHIDRARELLRDIHHIPIGTVNEDGTPHVSPVFLAFDDTLHGFWASSPGSLHSQNITRDPRIFLNVFDSRNGHGGLFLSGVAVELTDRQSIISGLEQLSILKKDFDSEMGNVESYMGNSTQRIYEFIPEQAWVNHSEKQGNVIVRDRRYKIELRDLATS